MKSEVPEEPGHVMPGTSGLEFRLLKKKTQKTNNYQFTRITSKRMKARNYKNKRICKGLIFF